MTNNDKSVLIIGGGLCGLICGAILSKEGRSVRIIEKHYVAGGGLHTFKREGIEFETGMHIIGGFQTNASLNRLFTYLGIMHKLQIKPTNEDGFDHVNIDIDGQTYRMATGRDNFVKKLASYFPEESENIQRYVNKIYEITESIPMYDLQMPKQTSYDSMDFMSISVYELISSYIRNPKLQAILAWNNTLYSGQKDKTPAYIGAFISKFYIEGSSRFIGGSQQVVDALVGVIVSHGGEVICGNGVKFIDIKDKQIQSVITENGQTYKANWYISTIYTPEIFNLVDTTKIQKSYRNRISNISNSYSLFKTYIIFKPNSFPYLDYNGYFSYDYNVWDLAECADKEWSPHGCLYITAPVTDNDVHAQKMVIMAAMKFDVVKQWEHTKTNKRGSDYVQFKKDCENKLLDMMENVFPNIRETIHSVFSSTPLTIRDYLNTKDGASFGTARDCKNMAASVIPIRTKINNMLFSGQCINLHGILGVSITSVFTCGELLGLEYLLNKINQSDYKQQENAL